MSLPCPIPCNLCGARDVEVIGERDRDGWPLRTTICRACGLVWSNPRPSAEDVRQYYSKEYRLEYKGRATPSLRHVARSGRGALNRYRVLAPFLKPGARVLDAGSGGGEVVYILRRKGFDASGLEPDQQYAQHARDTLGVPIQTGFVQDVVYPSQSFDAITMFHALEHVEDPVGILSMLKCWLKPDGFLLVEVPNVEAACVHPDHRFHFAHFYNFNRQTIEWVGRRAGFEPVETTTSSDGGNLTVIFQPSAGPSQDLHFDADNFTRVRSRVLGHTKGKYYLSAAPYRGPLDRLRLYLGDRAAARGRDSARDVLDGLLTQHS